MKFTLGWLKDHLDTDASIEAICDTLTMIGLEVEGVEDVRERMAPFRIGKVASAVQHPNADRLRLCMVDAGGPDLVQVVCGAPNAREGIKVVFAPPGTYIPGTGITLEKGVIRDVESNGMMCSERELMLSDEHDGIIELPADAPVGGSYMEYAGLGDPVIEIKLTPNRGDCLGVRGIARDLAAAGLGTLKPIDLSPVGGGYDSPIRWAIAPDTREKACPAVAGRHFRGVKNGPAPSWMQRRLTAIGLRPISALVDVTNYVSVDLGRPLHVYDAAKLEGSVLHMRSAKDGETCLALNGNTYTLSEGMTVIADAKGVHGIGGVMGGEETGCTEETTEVFLETAWFDPVSVAETGRKLDLQSDARYRFERTVDPESVIWGPEVAARLILKLCGGETSRTALEGSVPDWRRRASLRLSRLESFGGLAVPAAESKAILDRLGFATALDGDVIHADIPSWRPDVSGEHCLVEEVLRIHGFDKVPSVPVRPEGSLPPLALTLKQRRVAFAKKALAWRGMYEAVTWSFLGEAEAKLFGADGSLALANPISTDLAIMRPSILPGLIQGAQRNSNRGLTDIALFEVGPAWRDATPQGQDMIAAGVRAGRIHGRHWSEKTRNVDAYDAKGDVLAALEACGAPVGNLQVSNDAPGWYHPGRSGQFRLGPVVLARFGELHPRVLKALDAKGPMVGFEILMDAIPQPKSKGGKTRGALHASALQPVTRDFAFLVDESVEADQIRRAANSAEKQLISDVFVFDVYRGAELGEARKSVAIQVTLQPKDRSLTDQELEAIAQRITASVVKATGGTLRG